MSALYEESLKDGFLDISVASLKFVGINSPGCTSVKHLVFQEAVPTTLNPTLLVNHEIYFRAEGDPTLRKIHLDISDEIVSYSMSQVNSCQLAVQADSNQLPTRVQPPRKKLFSPSVSKSDSTASELVIERKPVTPGTVLESEHEVEIGWKFSKLQLSADAGAEIEISGKSSDDELQPNADAVAEVEIAGKSSDDKLQPNVNKEEILKCANVDNLMKYMTSHRNKGKVEFFHVFDCGSSLYHLREILRIFIKNVTLCAVVTDMSKTTPLNLPEENMPCLSLVIGTHKTTDLEKINDMQVFYINTKHPTSCDHDIATKIINQASTLAITKKAPFAWYLFGFRVQKAMALLSKNTLKVSQECMIIAEKLKMDKTTVKAALEYLTEQNMLLYFKNTLNDVVFSGINIFSHFFSILYNKKVDQYDKLWKKAIISESLMREVIECITDKAVSLNDYIKLLQGLLILAPIGSEYLIPCFLPTMNEKQINELLASVRICASSYIKCPSLGYEFASMLSVFLITQTEHDWTISDIHTQFIYKNCFIFFVRSSQSFVYLSFPGNGYLNLSVSYSKGSDVDLRKIAATVLRGLEISKLILGDQKTFQFKLSFLCPCGFPGFHTASYNKEKGTVSCNHDDAVTPFLPQDPIYLWLNLGVLLNLILCL